MSGHEQPEQGNRFGCGRCAVQDCPARADGDSSGVQGWRLGLSAAALFLAPIVLAIAGALWAGGGEGTRVIGALSGLGLGMVGSVVVARALGQKRRRRA